MLKDASDTGITSMDKSYFRTGGRKGAQRPTTPRQWFFMWLACALLSLGGLVFVATVVSAAANKSGYTQAHGLPRSGIVTSVANQKGKTSSADVGVRLGEPVDGQAATTAHLPSVTSLKPGMTVRVLVDPQDLSYAEFPGRRYSSEVSAELGVAIFLASFAVFGFLAARRGRVWLRQRQRGLTVPN
jgi:hypothetical protein